MMMVASPLGLIARELATEGAFLAAEHVVDHMIPWKRIADWTHALPVNPTDTWMDAAGRDQFFHRYAGHAFTDSLEVIRNPQLSLLDFGKHLVLDVITKQGIPAVPAEVTQFLANVFGTKIHHIAPWIQFNLLEGVFGIVMNAQAISSLSQAIGGNLEWGASTAFRTIGVGSAEIVGGISAENPLWISAGVIDVSAGTVSAYQYYSQPFFMGVPVASLLKSTAVGFAIGSTVSAVWQLFMPEKPVVEKVSTVMMGGAYGGAQTMLVTLLPWASAPSILLSLSYSAGKYMVKSKNKQVRNFKLFGKQTPKKMDRSIDMTNEELKSQLKAKVVDFYAEFDEAPDYASIQILSREIEKDFLESMGEIPRIIQNALVAIKALHNPDQQGRLAQIRKIISLGAAGGGSVGLFVGGFATATANTGIVAGISALVAGPAIPVIGPLVIAGSFLVTAAAVCGFLDDLTPHEVAARSMSILLEAIDQSDKIFVHKENAKPRMTQSWLSESFDFLQNFSFSKQHNGSLV
jgi:hypothetical protein